MSAREETETRELGAWEALARRLAESVPHDHSEAVAGSTWTRDGVTHLSAGNREGNCPRCHLDREIAALAAASLPTGGGRSPESVCLRCGAVGDGPGPAHACGGTSNPGEVAPLRECIEAFKRLPGIEGELDEISARAEGMEQTLDEVRGVLVRRGVVCEPVLAATVERLVVEREAARRALGQIDALTRSYVRGENEAPETVGEIASIARQLLAEQALATLDAAAASSTGDGERERLLVEFDAWLSMRGEFREVLTAFRRAFGTDTSAAASSSEEGERAFPEPIAAQHDPSYERGASLEYDVLSCGHRKEIGASAGAIWRRCDECARPSEEARA